jgi:hypothetical protein
MSLVLSHAAIVDWPLNATAQPGFQKDNLEILILMDTLSCAFKIIGTGA